MSARPAQRACAPQDRYDANGFLLPLVTGFRPAAFPPANPDFGQIAGEHVIETFNCSGGKSTLKKRLKVTRALVVIVQEFGHVADQVEAIQSWAQVRGWSLMALPSCPSAGNVPSAGVAVFVRSECGVRAPQLGVHQ
eukprot:6305141-Pyramimonas_sp.AAC.1